ncbi:hypothetical protein Syun_000610 [Stephania yunnanensis]|uniref:DYW domain-containing protein n=1 Tax=Stephania yunnanensis TaxID=152371 RepID=A0AAP0LDB9_9MAGN
MAFTSLSPHLSLLTPPPNSPHRHHHHHTSLPLPHSKPCNSTTQSLNHALLRLSVRRRDALLARAVHASLSKSRDHPGNSLILSYLKLGLLSDAHKVLTNMSLPNVVSYTALLSHYAKSGREGEAIELFLRMRRAAVEPNEYTFVAILTACVRLLDWQLGAQVQSLALKAGYCGFTYVSNSFMAMYVRRGHVDAAVRVFEEMLNRDLASWNTVIAGMVKDSRYDEGFELFREMQRIEGFRVDRFTLSTLLAAAANSLASLEGREIHGHALRVGFESDLSVNNALMEFYANCGAVENVVALFERMPEKDVISWTTMLTGYMDFAMVQSAVKLFNEMPEKNCISYNSLLAGLCRNGEGLQAVNLFLGMIERGMEISDFTLTSIVNACAMLADMKQASRFMGLMASAQKMFGQWSYEQNQSMVWTSMLCGYARNGQADEAVSLFCTTLAEGDVVMDEVALTAVLGICGTLGFHVMGKQLHCYVIKSGFLSDVGVENATFSMYSKCGNMEDAVRCFDLMRKRDVVSWNSLITAYLLHRQGDNALAVWSRMENVGIEPDSITLALVISAFRHTTSNLVDTCRSLFFSMKSLYGIEATSEHYASLVSVLGYWGCYDEAEELITNMPFKPDAYVWRALLDCCRLRSHARLGRVVAKQLLAIEPQDPSSYILLSNLYAASGRWHCSDRVRKEMKQKGLQKHPSRSWVIHQNKVHSFYARDKTHPETKDIYSGLDILVLQCLKTGYTPDTTFVLHEVEEHQKTDFLYYHSAKLALTYGILMTKPGRPVRVTKNILLCGDCHTFFKHASSVTGREICLRDSSGFHCFKNGKCSCGDYW